MIYGAADCNWKESRRISRGYGKNRRVFNPTFEFVGREVYLNAVTYLFGHENAETEIEMPRGIHRYEFCCTLPPLLPASFESKHGHIRYNVEVFSEFPRNFDKQFILQFTVIRNDDLNSDPELKIPCKYEGVKRFCILICGKPLTMTVNLPCSGFVSGQKIPVTINFDNKSGLLIYKTRIVLKRVIQLHG